MKLVVVGGGSSYTPELVAGLLNESGGLVSEIVLCDPDGPRVEAICAFTRRMVERAGASIRVDAAAETDTALAGADFVITQLRVGGQQARHEDIVMGLECGVIGQETTGVGGFAKALRTIPVMLKLAEQIREHAPNAWVLNFTNPSGLVTEALQRHTPLKCVGLCNVPIETQMWIAEALGVEAERVTLDWFGLNHLGWVKGIDVDGKQRLPEILERIENGALDAEPLIDYRYPPGMLSQLGMLPSSYLRFYYTTEEILSELRGADTTRAQDVMEIDRQLFAIYGDGVTNELPALLQQRGGAWYSRLAVQVMRALVADTPAVHILNATNGATISSLPAHCTVEVPCEVSRNGITPMPRDSIPEVAAGLMSAVKSYEELAIRACVEHNREAAYLALLANPLVGNVHRANELTKRLIDRDLI